MPIFQSKITQTIYRVVAALAQAVLIAVVAAAEVDLVNVGNDEDRCLELSGRLCVACNIYICRTVTEEPMPKNRRNVFGEALRK